jgi:hypothetical protein
VPNPHLSSDLITYEQFVEMMKPTGRAPTADTARRWAREDRLSTYPDPRDRRRQVVWFSDLLAAHRNRQN